MTAQVIDLAQHRRTREPAEQPVEAIRGFLNDAAYRGVDTSHVCLVVPITSLDRLMAATLPDEGGEGT